MRRQYHSRIVGGHTLTWDIHRLVEMTKRLPVRSIPINSIRELDECFWFSNVQPTCREVALHAKLISETDLKYPIILSEDGRVMDGMHRVCKALLENRESIGAVQFEKDPQPDYIDVDEEKLSYDEP